MVLTGAMEFILIPFGAHSMERLLLRFSMAALAAPECLQKKERNFTPRTIISINRANYRVGINPQSIG